MDKRKLRLILLGVVGVLILVIGIAAANIYFGVDPVQDKYAQAIYGKNWKDLTEEQQNEFYELRPDLLGPNLDEKNAQFTKWIVTWIVKPLGLFVILVAALVVSRVIFNRIRPPSSPG